ncbi:MAG: hypothetical protein KJS97_07885 [Alphaproteobacteria bacterium]|nr:hypothetical protein [Alphaproteobacteria bacterium]
MALVPRDILALALLAYAAAGVGVTVFALAAGLRRIDPTAIAAPLAAKLMWTPGLIALWPIVAARMAGRMAPEDRT